jgi:hypothetical protein
VFESIDREKTACPKVLDQAVGAAQAEPELRIDGLQNS